MLSLATVVDVTPTNRFPELSILMRSVSAVSNIIFDIDLLLITKLSEESTCRNALSVPASLNANLGFVSSSVSISLGELVPIPRLPDELITNLFAPASVSLILNPPFDVPDTPALISKLSAFELVWLSFIVGSPALAVFTSIVPATVSFSLGEVVPIPTLPSPLICILTFVLLVAKDIPSALDVPLATIFLIVRPLKVASSCLPNIAP